MDKQIKVSYYTAYKVGGLLYTPASDKAIAKKLINKEYDCLTSVALCLEDSIDDKALPMAEQQLKQTLTQLLNCNTSLPLVFVRVRDCDHFKRIHDLLKEEEAVIDGYIFPKFDLTNSSTYCKSILDYNQKRQKPLYLMPILESKSIADTGNRVNTLREIKRQLDDIKQYVLNIRVGGNDFSNIYGLRRSETQTIYDIGVIRDILVDIINVFSSDYVISGPVWEYFDDRRSDLWKDGLKRELELDLLNGFFGKTAIHPSQLPIIYESLKVSRRDYEDAVQILNWHDHELAVFKGANGDRMNEVKCHTRWANQIVVRAKIYGIKQD